MDKQNQADSQSSVREAQPPSPPEGWYRHQENNLNGWIFLSEIVEQRSHSFMPLLGYGLLLFGLFDYIAIIIPPQFTNPAWELKTIGDFVEHVAIPLLGMLLVFYRHQGYIFKLEKRLLGFLSWVCLLVGLLYLLMLPLGVADTWRLYNANKVQVSSRMTQQHQQFEKAKRKLNQAKTDEQIKQVVTSLTPTVRSEDIKEPQAFKDQFLTKISEGELQIQIQADKVWTDQSQTLLKNAVKWNLGALVAGVLFIVTWHLTDWARGRE